MGSNPTKNSNNQKGDKSDKFQMEKEYYGRLMRHLIDNHNKDRLVSKTEIKELFLIDNTEIDSLLSRTQSFMASFGLEIVGFLENEIVALSKANKFFIRRGETCSSIKKPKIGLKEDERVLFIIFSLIQMEKNKVDEKKILDALSYLGENLEGLLREFRMRGYLIQKKENETNYLCYGWRFYAEYGESFDILEFFRSNDSFMAV